MKMRMVPCQVFEYEACVLGGKGGGIVLCFKYPLRYVLCLYICTHSDFSILSVE